MQSSEDRQEQGILKGRHFPSGGSHRVEQAEEPALAAQGELGASLVAQLVKNLPAVQEA